MFLIFTNRFETIFHNKKDSDFKLLTFLFINVFIFAYLCTLSDYFTFTWKNETECEKHIVVNLF